MARPSFVGRSGFGFVIAIFRGWFIRQHLLRSKRTELCQSRGADRRSESGRRAGQENSLSNKFVDDKKLWLETVEVSTRQSSGHRGDKIRAMVARILSEGCDADFGVARGFSLL